MTFLKGIKKFQDPTFTKIAWEAFNPFLSKGMTGHELNDDGIVVGSKCGPGYWNDLPYETNAFYPYIDPVTNALGDLTLQSNQKGRLMIDIIKDIISPFQRCVVSGPTNNAKGNYANKSVIEIGNSLSGTITIQFNVSNQNNLEAGNNLYIYAGGIFTEEGWRAYSSGSVVLTLINPLNPALITTYTIQIKVKDKHGDSAIVTTTVTFNPKLIWGNTTNANISGVGFASIPHKHTKIASTYKGDFAFDIGNYLELGIPDMLDPTAVVFTDVTDPNRPAGISMEDQGLKSVNNGVGTYNYRLYRSTYLLLNPVTLRVS